jgi:hypothetical protein
MGRLFIFPGDKTDHGGTVITAHASFSRPGIYRCRRAGLKRAAYLFFNAESIKYPHSFAQSSAQLSAQSYEFEHRHASRTRHAGRPAARYP